MFSLGLAPHFHKTYNKISFMKVPPSSLAPILRSDAQGRILARVLGTPEASYSLSDLVELSQTSMPTVLREIRRAEQAGIVATRKDGPLRRVEVRTDHPLYEEVRKIVLATYGLPIIVAEEFADIRGANAVLLFGSWAARYAGEPGRVPHDIDVLVIGEADRDAADDAAERVERRVGIPVNATVRSRSQWESCTDSFIVEVKSRPTLIVLGSGDPPH